MVGHRDVQMEWKDSPQDEDRHGCRLRCITAGMGSLLWNTNYKGSMVTGGGNSPHKPLLLLAATIAVQSFAKHKYKLNILLRIDNTTAVTSTIWGRPSQETWSI